MGRKLPGFPPGHRPCLVSRTPVPGGLPQHPWGSCGEWSPSRGWDTCTDSMSCFCQLCISRTEFSPDTQAQWPVPGAHLTDLFPPKARRLSEEAYSFIHYTHTHACTHTNLTALLRQNVYPIQFAHIKYIIKWFSVYTQCYATITIINFRTFITTSKRNNQLISSTPHLSPTSLPSCKQPLIYFFSQ